MASSPLTCPPTHLKQVHTGEGKLCTFSFTPHCSTQLHMSPPHSLALPQPITVHPYSALSTPRVIHFHYYLTVFHLTLPVIFLSPDLPLFALIHFTCSTSSPRLTCSTYSSPFFHYINFNLCLYIFFYIYFRVNIFFLTGSQTGKQTHRQTDRQTDRRTE